MHSNSDFCHQCGCHQEVSDLRRIADIVELIGLGPLFAWLGLALIGWARPHWWIVCVAWAMGCYVAGRLIRRRRECRVCGNRFL